MILLVRLVALSIITFVSKDVSLWLGETLSTYISRMSAINNFSVSSHTYSLFKKGALSCITANQPHEKPVGIKAN